jgi:hypothetical protein
MVEGERGKMDWQQGKGRRRGRESAYRGRREKERNIG